MNNEKGNLKFAYVLDKRPGVNPIKLFSPERLVDKQFRPAECYNHGVDTRDGSFSN